MARSPANVTFSNGGVTTYTIPSGKYFVAAAHSPGASSVFTRLQVDGIDIMRVGNSGFADSRGPLVLLAGQVVTAVFVTGSPSIFLTGFLFDAA